MCLQNLFSYLVKYPVLLFIIYLKSPFKMLKIKLFLDRPLSEIQEIVFILAPVRTHIMYINAVFSFETTFCFSVAARLLLTCLNQ